MKTVSNITNALPQKSTLALSPQQRSLGRLIKLKPETLVQGDAQADLLKDTFHALYQSEPQPKSIDALPEERHVNAKLLDWLRNTQGFTNTRANTAGSLLVSSRVAPPLWQTLLKDEALQEALQGQELAEETADMAKSAHQKARQHELAADAMRQAGHNEQADNLDNMAEVLAQNAEEFSEEAQKIGQKAGEKLDQALESEMGYVHRAAIAAAAVQAEETAKEAAEIARGWGFGPGSENGHIDAKTAQEFWKQNQGKIAEIAKLAGRMKGVALNSHFSTSRHGFVPTNIAYTRDLLRALPTELAKLSPLADETTRTLQLAKWAQRGLLGWELSGNAEEEGDFIVAVDVSGSMRGAPEIAAKGIALGVAQAAKMTGNDRKWLLTTFGDGLSDFQKATSDQPVTDWMKWAAFFPGGGTNYDDAFVRIISTIVFWQSRKNKGVDLVLITDGKAALNNAVERRWRRLASQTGTRLFFVSIGKHINTQMRDLADKTLTVQDIVGQEENIAKNIGGFVR